MPQIPIPNQVPIERADWNTGFQGAPGAAASAVGSPTNPIDVAQQQQAQLTQNNQRTAATASDINDMQAKQRSMQLSMLSGALNEPDPDKQRQILQNIVPIANRINPSYQIDPNIDIPTVRALVQSQVTPTEQATLANNLQRAQMVNSLKAQDVTTDPATGQKIIIDKYTGVQRPITSQENEYYNANGQLPGEQGIGQPAPTTTGIFPSSQRNPQAVFQDFKNGAVPIPVGGGQPLTGNELGGSSVQPVFGLPPSNYSANPNALKLDQKTAAAFEQSRAQRDILADQAEQKLNELEPDLIGSKDSTGKTIGGVQGGPSLWTQLGFGLDKVSLPGSEGSKELNNASLSEGETKDLANTLSQMQVQPGSRGTKIALQTLLSSKPDPYNQTPEANQKLLTNARTAINQYRLETDFLSAYKDANPQHIIDNRAYDLFDAMQKQIPISNTGKDGVPTFNQDNVAAFKDAIPDALSNPQKYLNAKSQAQEKLQQPQQRGATNQANNNLQKPSVQQNSQPQGTPINTPEAVGAALQSGKITEAQARQLWSSQGLK